MSGAGTVREALGAAADALVAAGVETPRLDAEVLLAEATGWDRAQPRCRARRRGRPRPPPAASARWSGGGRAASPSPTSSAARASGGLELEVDGRALIPRPETELLVEIALELRPRRALDVGTGSGAVALAVADELPECEVTATDTSGPALDAGASKRRACLGRAGAGSASSRGTVPEDEAFDLVVANLPYVRDDEWDGLAPEINATSRARPSSRAPTGSRRSPRSPRLRPRPSPLQGRSRSRSARARPARWPR